MPPPASLIAVPVGNVLVELYAPDTNVVRVAYEKGEISFPYWAKIWPAAVGLADAILRSPAYTKGKTILELGAGLGLPSLMAACNAKQVICTDCIQEAVDLAKRSADHLRLKNFRAEVMNWAYSDGAGPVDVLLLSDVNYEPSQFDLLQNLVQKFLQKGTSILLSTPQRLVAKEFISSLLKHSKRQDEFTVVQHGTETLITVLLLEEK